MQHYILRCKHCHKEYTYCTYGNGPEYGTEFGCSMDYCAECQSAIDNALSQITKKFEARDLEIDQPGLFSVFDKIRAEEEKKEKLWPNIHRVGECGDYDNAEIYIHDRKKFYVRWNDDTPAEKHIFISMEYDLLNNEFTKNPWKYDVDDCYMRSRNELRCLARALMNEQALPLPKQALPLPNGKLNYMDFEWDVVLPTKKDKTSTPQPKAHNLITEEQILSGWALKATIDRGWVGRMCKLANGVSPGNIIDYLDYKITVERYEDENFATIVKIENH